MPSRANYRSRALSEFNRRLSVVERVEGIAADPLHRFHVLEQHMREIATGLKSGQPPEHFRLATIAAHSVAWLADDLERMEDGSH